jgi:hypothetical protein
MISLSIIKCTVLCGFCILSFSVLAQNTEENTESKNNTTQENSTANSRQRFGAFSIGFHKPIPTGNNFVGKGMRGKSGFDFKLQLYVYKQFFIGGSAGASYLEVKDASVTGNYEKTTVAEQFLYLGYEFLPFENWRIGVQASIIGDAVYKNKFLPESKLGLQTDSARYHGYGFYINYELGENAMFYIDYIYRTTQLELKPLQGYKVFSNMRNTTI